MVESSAMQQCAICRKVGAELEKAALEYLLVIKNEDEEKHVSAARKKMVEAQKRFNIHKKTHKKTIRRSAKNRLTSSRPKI